MRIRTMWCTAIALTGLLLGPSRAQAEQFIWASQFGAGAQRGFAVDADGNSYVVGDFSGTVTFDPVHGGSTLTAVDLYDGFIVKVSAAGNFVWARQIAGTSYQSATAVALDANGFLHIVGTLQGTADFDPGPGTYMVSASGPTNQDVFVLELDAQGNFVSVRTIGTHSATFSSTTVRSVAIDASGNILTVGEFSPNADFDPGPGTFLLITGGVYISKLDSAGNFVWAGEVTAPGAGGRLEAYHVAVDALGFVYTVGLYPGSTTDFDPGGGVAYLVSNSSSFLLALNPSGQFVYVRATGGNGSLTQGGVAVDAARNVYVSGQFFHTSDFDPGPGTFNMTSAGDFDVFVAKYNPIGAFQWARRMGGPQMDYPEALALTSTGQVYVAGIFEATADFDPGAGDFFLTTVGARDGFTCKLDAGGNFVTAWQVGATTSGSASGVAVDTRDDVYTNGFFSTTADFDPGPGTHVLSSASGSSFIQKVGTVGAGAVAETSGSLQPLTLAKLGGSMLQLAWGSSCNFADADYEIYEGTLGNFTSHVPVVCTTGGATTAPVSPAAGNRYFVVVPSGAPGIEGSYGTKSPGVERPPSVSACLPQTVRSCP